MLIFGNLISISIVILFMNLQDRACLKLIQSAPRSHNSLQSRQLGPPGLSPKGGKGKGADSGLDNSSECKTYMMMGARGTTEPQGSSMAYTSMAKNVLQAVPGGGLMDIQYPSSAEYMKTPQDGAATGLKYIQAQVAKCPKMVFVLMGYSKGAMVQSQILANKDLPPKKVVATVLFGNPYFKAGAPQNKCEAKTGKGIMGGMTINIPADYTDTIFDCCLNGDTVCQSSGGMSSHLKYGGQPAAEAQAFIISKLKGKKIGGDGSGGKSLKTRGMPGGGDGGSELGKLAGMGGKGGGMGKMGGGKMAGGKMAGGKMPGGG
ncbi:hypothetical protein MJO28_007315 [Puccinia striiformis f. sp. tritici]|uniref:Cutinase n=2 Tax=Puccinia striiformis f. sp. tritici TaxID=168172 RepID=A0A0L0VHY4_9BASI|nr:hypothetical protein Pst134EA_013430 [Puccinia striiformis f. sp. tritici]KAI9603808.1 hypothetical protein H4Q26_003411 [Puccinia striiformis f. sp. tritici PST-130]KNE98831.1 hypothetical protein PSTG_07853 [Puccinia striiformis f. sp. tritici PST-78]KAH9465549.1 hypothetical protein Pst134EA_013430 [Puccinia striiformis f. sp. tritici]KAI7951631.1 hypothetical protein MJO28_007315 [Puccinia striiformis f. sp. tritici]KAI7955861.1 hypothetical protein MJO29_007260 [Puccinia striiformis f.